MKKMFKLAEHFRKQAQENRNKAVIELAPIYKKWKSLETRFIELGNQLKKLKV